MCSYSSGLVKNFQTGDFNLDEHSHIVYSPSVVENNVLKASLDADPRLNLTEIVIKMECWTETTSRHLEEIDKVHKKTFA